MQTNGGVVQAGPKFWKTTYGVMNAVSDDNVITSSLEQHGQWVESELDLLSGLLQEGATVVEVGSEYGAHALCLSRVVGDAGEVHVLESDRLVHLQLCANMALNGVRNVYAHLPLKGKQAYPNIRNLDLAALHCVKVNATGTLVDFLADARELIRQHKPYVYFRLDSPVQAREEVAAIKALGYRCWSHIAYWQGMSGDAGNDASLFPGWAHQNVIAAPLESGVDADFAHLREI